MRAVITSATSDAGSVAARCLRRAGFTVFGVDARRMPRILASRHLDGYACVGHSDPRDRQDATLEFVRRVRADVLLPLCTPGAMLAAQRHHELESLCRTCAPPMDAFLSAYDKRRCMEACRQMGIPCAGSLSRDEAADLLGRCGQSVIVKPAIDAGAARDIRDVATVDQLDDAVREVRLRHGECLIQERIPGDAGAMHMLTVVMGEASQVLAAFTARKLRHWPSTGGVTAYGVSTRRQDLLDRMLPLFNRWHWRGPAEVELKRDPRDGQFKVIEVNPRLPGYIRLASACGLDLPAVAASAALGAASDPSDGLSRYSEGVRYIAPTVFLKSVLAHARTCGLRVAIGGACRDAAQSGPMLCSLIKDPVPIIVRSVVPKRRCRSVSCAEFESGMRSRSAPDA